MESNKELRFCRVCLQQQNWATISSLPDSDHEFLGVFGNQQT